MEKRLRTAIYAGTFDPITLGHLDLIERASKLFDNLIVLVGVNAGKSPMFSVDERKDMISNSITHILNVKVDTFDGLIVKYAKKYNAKVLLRGVRAFQDFEYELQMALINRRLDGDIETVFLMPKNEYSFLSSTLIKGISGYDCDMEEYVPKYVALKIKEKFQK